MSHSIIQAEEWMVKLDRKEEELEQMRRDAVDIKVEKESQTRTIDALNKEITDSNQQVASSVFKVADWIYGMRRMTKLVGNG